MLKKEVAYKSIGLLLGIMVLLIACEQNTTYSGSYSFCNDKGFYNEVTFLSADKIIVSHEWIPWGETYRFEVVGDSMFTYDHHDGRVSGCRIISHTKELIHITYSEYDTTYHFWYKRISGGPVITEDFSDTATVEYRNYKSLFDARMKEKGCIPVDTVAPLKLKDIDIDFEEVIVVPEKTPK